MIQIFNQESDFEISGDAVWDNGVKLVAVEPYMDVPSPTATATTENASGLVEYGFDTDLLTTGSWVNNAWLSNDSTNQRIVLDLGEAKTLYGVRISNFHHLGSSANRGIKTTAIYGSNDSGDYTSTYGTDIDLTELWAGIVVQHTSADEVEWQELSFPTPGIYRYLVLEVSDNWGDGAYMGFRRVEVKTSNGIPQAEAVIDADATAGSAFDLSTSLDTSSGSPTIRYQYTIDAEASTYNGTDLTLAELQAESDTDYQNTKFKIILTGNADDVYSQFSIDTYALDLTAPTDVSATANAAFSGETSTYDLMATFTGGTDTGGSGYAGANLEIEEGGVSYFQQSDGSFDTDETFANLLLKGDADTRDIIYALGHSEVPTRFRINSWDEAENYNRGEWHDFYLIGEVDYPDETDVFNGVVYDNGNKVGTFAPYATTTQTGNLVLPPRGKVLDDTFFDSNASVQGELSTGAPNSPIVTKLVSNDVGELTISVLANAPDDSIYVRYRKMGASWSAENEAYKLIGSGDLDIIGLDEDTSYEATAYAKALGMSDWAAPLIALTKGTYTSSKNVNWERWVFASICKHFNDRKGDYDLYIEGQYRNTKPNKDFFELRVDGPYITEESKGYYKLYLEINILVQSRMDNNNYHRIHQDVGFISSLFTAIKLFKFGNGSEDTQEQFGCLRLLQNTQNRNRIQINHFGQIDPKVRLMQATVEGHYTTELIVN